MASSLHGCARTTPRVRAELQASEASTRALAAQYGLNPKTVAKWRKRDTVEDAPMGPSSKRSTVLIQAEETSIAELRRSTMLPLDDLLGRLLKDIPRLSRSSLHRCLQRQGISRLSKGESDSKRGRFSETVLGYVHVDSCEVRSAEGKRHLFLAADRVTKLIVTHLYESANMAAGADFMARVVGTFPYRLHTVLTDDGKPFSHQPRYRDGATAAYSPHVFDRVCRANGVKHRLTKPYHPWTNGQAERMVRTLKEATVKRFQHDTVADLEAHLRATAAAHDLAKHIKGLSWRTPFQAVCDAWKKDPSAFKADPHHTDLSMFASSPDDRLIVLPEGESGLAVRSMRAGRRLFALDGLAEEPDRTSVAYVARARISSMTFSGDGHRLLVLYSNGRLRTFRDDR